MSMQALFLVALLGLQQPDLSNYGSLARQQTVRDNLRLQQEHAYLRFREKRREQLPQQTIIYTRHRVRRPVVLYYE